MVYAPVDYQNMFSLEDKTAVITGGSGGLGFAIADGFTQFGARVALLGTSVERGEAAAGRLRSLGREADFHCVDVSDSRRVDEAVSEIHGAFGRIDVLVNAAGIFRTGRLEDLSDEDIDIVMRVNVTGTFYMCRAVGRIMLEQEYGKIINFSSTDAYLGVQEQPVYCASKGAVNQLTRVLAVDWIKHGIHVNAIAPCDFDTPMIKPFLETQEYRDWIIDAIPAGRVGRPSEIVGAALYLASDASSMVVGHTLLVDGGRTVI